MISLFTIYDNILLKNEYKRGVKMPKHTIFLHNEKLKTIEHQVNQALGAGFIQNHPLQFINEEYILQIELDDGVEQNNNEFFTFALSLPNINDCLKKIIQPDKFKQILSAGSDTLYVLTHKQTIVSITTEDIDNLLKQLKTNNLSTINIIDEFNGLKNEYTLRILRQHDESVYERNNQSKFKLYLEGLVHISNTFSQDNLRDFVLY